MLHDFYLQQAADGTDSDDSAAVVGLDLGAPLELPRGGQRLCQLAFELASRHSLTVFDPQLGRAVTQGDEQQIVDRFEQSAAFTVAASSARVEGSVSSLSPSAKLWLLVVGLIVLVMLASRSITCLTGV